MKKILITAYAVNPYKGSEDAMGWNIVLQAARNHEVIVVTRKNNQPAIDQFIALNPNLHTVFSQLSFLYFDWPKWLIFWKKGPLLSMIYFYFWQLSVAIWLKFKALPVDVVHNLNFHNDWTPTFLFILDKPLVWGHIGHHSKIPTQYIYKTYGAFAYLKDRFLWAIKNFFWYVDPFLAICKRRAAVIICMNKDVVAKLRLKNNYIIHPSVAADEQVVLPPQQHIFNVLSVGRFVPLKGFDLTIKSFAKFYHQLSPAQQQKTRLTLIGKGPTKEILLEIALVEGVLQAIDFIGWIPHDLIKRHYQNASVFLFPSHEGAGMVVPEAMSFSVPVVCFAGSGPGDFVHPETTLTVNIDAYSTTITQLASKLNQLFTNQKLMEKERALSLNRFQELFRWNVRGDMLHDVYAQALNEV